MLVKIINNKIIGNINISNSSKEQDFLTNNPDYIKTDFDFVESLDLYEYDGTNFNLVSGWEAIKTEREAEANNAIINDDGVQVPKTITKRQAREIIIRMGLFNTVETAIEAIGDETEKLVIRNFWDHSDVFERDSTTLNQFATIIELSQEELDQMFIDASKL